MARDSYSVRLATADDAQSVGCLVARLLDELSGGSGQGRRLDELVEVAQRLLADGGIAALLAWHEQNGAVAVLTLCECAALYTGGRFGVIAEFYVEPAHRSSGLGALMIEAAAEQARGRGWSRLEVGAPDLPRWQRTVDFYKRCGFVEVGPRLKLTWG